MHVLRLSAEEDLSSQTHSATGRCDHIAVPLSVNVSQRSTYVSLTVTVYPRPTAYHQ